MSEQDDLVERLRELLAAGATVREVRMLGTRALMVREKLLVGALRNGGLLVRVDPGRHEELAARPGAAQAVMGKSRTMGAGWLEVAPAALVGDGLEPWLEAALEYRRASGD